MLFKGLEMAKFYSNAGVIQPISLFVQKFQAYFCHLHDKVVDIQVLNTKIGNFTYRDTEWHIKIRRIKKTMLYNISELYIF